MQKLSSLKNIGPALEKQLTDGGIDSPHKLREAGSKKAWLSILSRDPSACLMRLWSLEGAIRGVKWRDLDEEVRGELKEFYNSVKKGEKP